MRIGIAGTGAIALASAAWLAQAGHAVALWSPRGAGTHAQGDSAVDSETAVVSQGLVDARMPIRIASSAAALAAGAQVLLIAVPVNAHRLVIDALLPQLRDGQTVIVSSMGSLSSLYLMEAARAFGRDITVASFGTTVFTGRRTGPFQVRVTTRRKALGVSALPRSRIGEVLRLCAELFGEGFSAQENALESVLANVNPISHGPLALFNWTRIERGEAWPQYHYMTPAVAAVIARLDAERLALGRAFGLRLDGVERHFARSFGTQAAGLAEIAAELHAKRGGPPGPVSMDTRYLTEDMPFGLAFQAALGRMAGVPTPATQTIVDAASLVAQQDFAAQNDLLEVLYLDRETPEGLLERVNR